MIYPHLPGASSWPRRWALPLPALACLASPPEEAPEQGQAPFMWGEGQPARWWVWEVLRGLAVEFSC